MTGKQAHAFDMPGCNHVCVCARGHVHVQYTLLVIVVLSVVLGSQRTV
jgi:hypothetical protein